jgi:Undecaprenyl-phosphate galactose phosphotransferase WbaP
LPKPQVCCSFIVAIQSPVFEPPLSGDYRLSQNTIFQDVRGQEMPGETAALNTLESVFETRLVRWWTRALRVRLAREGLLATSDLSALLVSWLFAYFVWAGPVLHQRAEIYRALLPLLLMFPLSYAANGLYPGFGLGAVETLRRLSYSTTFSFIAMAACSFVFKASSVYSRMAFVIAWVMSLVTVPLLRFAVLSAVSGLSWWGEPTVIFGTARQARLTVQLTRRAFSLGYRIVGILSPDLSLAGRQLEDLPVLGGLEQAEELARAGVSTVLVWNSLRLTRIRARLQDYFRHVVLVHDAEELPTEYACVRNLGGLLGIEFTNQLLRRKNQAIKRSLDVIVAAAVLMAAAPIIAICVVVIKIDSPGPAFFAQEREGLNARKFKVWKLRTMYPNAEALLAERLANDDELRREWHRNMKLVRDPRIIPLLGTLLRRLSIDELPQLWNVIRGQMSLVGPRPLPEYHLARFSPAFRTLRATVRPGLSGMWQVMIRNNGGLEEQELFDRFYIRNWSLWLDFYVMVRTVFATLTAKGAQ